MSRNGKDTEIKKDKSAKDVVNKVLSDVSQKGKTLFHEGWDSAKQALQENAENLKVKAGEFSEKSVDEISEEVKTFVQKKPLQTVMIAVGLGFILGFLFKD